MSPAAVWTEVSQTEPTWAQLGFPSISPPDPDPTSPVGIVAKYIKFTTNASAPQAVTGVGFRGKAGIFWTVGTTTGQDGTIQNDQHISFGFCSGTSSAVQRCSVVWAPTAQNPAVCRKELADAVVALFLNTGAIDQALVVSAWNDDGFTVSKPVNVGSGYDIHCLILGGSYLTGEKVSQADVDGTVVQAYTGIGFQPDGLLFAGVRGQNTAALPGTLNLDNHSTMSLGAAISAASRWALSNSGQNGAATASTLGAVAFETAAQCLSLLTVTSTPSQEKTADLVTLDSDGYTLNLAELGAPSAGRRTAVMALKGPQVAVGTFNRTGGPVTLPFTPIAHLLFSTHRASTTNVDGDSQVSIGGGDGSGQGAVWARLRDNQIPTISARCSKAGASFITADTTPTLDSVGTVSYGANSMTLTSSPSGAINDEICYIALGPSLTVPEVSDDLTYQDITVPFDVPEVGKPAYMVPMIEPTFRHPDFETPTVTRIADDPGNTAPITVLETGLPYTMTWGGQARHRYSKDQPWNRTGTMYLMAHNSQSDTHNATFPGDPTKIILDGNTMRPIYKFGPVCEANLSEYRWHPLAIWADVLVNVTSDGKTLQWINVRTGQILRSWDLSPKFPNGVDGFGDGEGNMSDDGRYISLFKVVDPTGVASNDCDLCVVDMEVLGSAGIGPVLRVVSTSPAAQKTNQICTWSTMSASGDYVILHWRGEKTSVLDLNKTTLTLSERNLGAFGSGLGGDQWVSANYAITTHNGTPNIESAGLFPAGIVGAKITGAGIQAGTIIIAYTDSSNAVMGKTATASASVTARMGDEADHGYIWRMGHGDVTHNPEDSDADVIIGQDQRLPIGDAFNGRPISHVVMVRLSDGSPTSITPVSIGGVSEMSSHHISTRNKDRPGWCYVSYFEKTSPVARLYQQEITAIKLLPDGATSGWTMQRFAHHHSDHSTLGGNPNTYQAEAHPVASWDGQRIIFASDWARECNGNCGNNSYMGGFPSGIYQDYMIQAFFGDITSNETPWAALTGSAPSGSELTGPPSTWTELSG